MCPQRRSQMWAFATILMAVVALTSGEAAVAGGSSLSPDASESCVAGDDTCAGEQALLAADQDPTPDSAHKHNTNTAVSGSEGADPDAAKSDAVEPDAESSVLSWRLVSVVIVTGILGLAYVAGAFAKSSATVAVAREYWRFQTLDLNVTVTRFHKDSDKHMYLFFRFIADEDCASMLRAEEDMPKVPASDLGAVEQPVVAEKRTKLGNNRVRVERLLEVPLTWSTMAAGATSPGKSESHDEASTDAVLEVTVPADRASVCLSDAPATVRVGFLFGSEPIHIDSINNDTLQLCELQVHPNHADPQAVQFDTASLSKQLAVERDLCRDDNFVRECVVRQLQAVERALEAKKVMIRNVKLPVVVNYPAADLPSTWLHRDSLVLIPAIDAVASKSRIPIVGKSTLESMAASSHAVRVSRADIITLDNSDGAYRVKMDVGNFAHLVQEELLARQNSSLTPVFLMNNDIAIDGNVSDEVVGAFVSTFKAHIYVPTPDVVRVQGRLVGASTADDGSAQPEEKNDSATGNTRYVGGSVQVVWLHSIFNEDFGVELGVALCFKDPAKAQWIPQDEPVRLRECRQVGSGGLNVYWEWHFSGSKSPRVPGEYRIQLFVNTPAGMWKSVWESAHEFSVHSIPPLRFTNGVTPVGPDSTGHESGPILAQAGCPIEVCQPLPSTLGEGVTSWVVLYELVGVEAGRPGALEQQLRSARGTALQPALDAFFNQEAAMEARLCALEALAKGMSESPFLRSHHRVPVDPTTGITTLTADAPGWYIVVYNQTVANSPALQRMDRQNTHHLLDCLKEHAASRLIFVSPPQLFTCVTGSNEDVHVMMGDPLIVQLSNVASKRQQGDIVLQQAVTGCVRDSGAQEVRRRWEELRSVEAVGKVNRTDASLHGLAEGSYVAILRTDLALPSTPVGPNTSAADDGVSCALLEFEVGLYHNPSSSLAEALQFQRHSGGRGFGLRRVSERASVDPTAASWVDTSVRVPLSSAESVTVPWLKIVRQMQSDLETSPSLDEDAKREQMEDLVARLKAVGRYQAEPNMVTGETEFVHESGSFVIRRVVEHHVNDRLRKAHWSLFREARHDDFSTEECDEDIEVAMQSVSFEFDEFAPAGSAEAGKLPFELPWQMRVLETAEWADCGSGPGGGTFDIHSDSLLLRNRHQAADGNSDDSAGEDANNACQVVISNQSPLRLTPGCYRAVYEKSGLPLGVSGTFVIGNPQLSAKSQSKEGQYPRSVHEPGADITFQLDGMELSQSNGLEVHVFRRTVTQDLVNFGPRVDFVRSNASQRFATVCIRLPPQMPRTDLSQHFVALFPYPLPTNDEGDPDVEQFVPGTKASVGDFAFDGSQLQHDCLVTVPLWDAMKAPVTLAAGVHVAVYFIKGASGSWWPFSATDKPQVLSQSGQFLRVDSSLDVWLEEDARRFRPPLDPISIYDRSVPGQGDVDDEGMPSKEALRNLHLWQHRDDHSRDEFELPAVLAKFTNLYIAMKHISSAGIRRFDLVQFQPPSGKDHPRVRRVRSLRSIARFSHGQSPQESDWLEWHDLVLPASTQLSAVIQKVGTAAVEGAKVGVSGLHGQEVALNPRTRLFILGRNADGAEVLTFAPRYADVFWVSTRERLVRAK